MMTSYRVSALLRMLSKRVELITAQTEEHHDPLRKLNRNYSLHVANSLVSGTIMSLQSISAYWRVYGLHYVLDCYEYHAPIATVFAHDSVLFELQSISWSGTRLNSLVQSLTFEIDRKMAMGEHQLEYRKQLEIIMLELAHTPVEFTALDFVSVNNNLVTDRLSNRISVSWASHSGRIRKVRYRSPTKSSWDLVTVGIRWYVLSSNCGPGTNMIQRVIFSITTIFKRAL
ncbi:hypothetical protein J6590_046696 [Homalodisca vitripennis]|nr:hypothetical protein J6590_046696 [Homalodisca vitripennis]